MPIDPVSIAPGQIYEDCAFHPVLCVESNVEEDYVRGISLVGGTYPHECSLRHCGVRLLTTEEAWRIRIHGPDGDSAKEAIAEEDRWWLSGEDE